MGAPVMLLTVGHSSRSLDVLLRLLRIHGVQRVFDVRRVPRSGRHPHFDQVPLAAALAAGGFAYEHVPDLGGLRRPSPGSANTAWREPAFQGYADHMQSPAFESGLAAVIAGARRERVVLMCAEASPWHCHRSLIADALVARGRRVEHILDEHCRVPHHLHPAARIVAGKVVYPSPQMKLEVET